MLLWEMDPTKELPVYHESRFSGMTGATTDAEVTVFTAFDPVVITDAQVVFDAAVTGANTNYASVDLNLYRAGTKVGAVASVAFVSGKDAVQFEAVDMGTLANNSLEAGDVLTVALVHTGTGIQLPAGLAAINIRPPMAGGK